MARRERDRERTVGALLVIAALLLIIGNILHARPGAEAADIMAVVADDTTLWRISHSLIALGTVLLAIGALTVIVGHNRLADRRSTTVAWTTLVIVMPILTVAIVAELSVFPIVADAGDFAAFERWEALAFTGITHAALLMFLALLLIAGDQFRRDHRAVHKGAAAIGSVAALIGVVGAVIVGVLRMHELLPVFGVSLLITFAWVLWFGISLFRSGTGTSSVVPRSL